MKKFLFFLVFFIFSFLLSQNIFACENDGACLSGSSSKCYFPNDAALTGTCVSQSRYDELKNAETGGGSTGSGPVEVDVKGKGYVGGLSSVISGSLQLVFIIATLASFGFLIFGGMEWITSGGDSGKLQSARGKIMAAVIGLLVLASTWAIMNFVVSLLGYKNLEETVENTPSLGDE
jgi:hypothetical protein